MNERIKGNQKDLQRLQRVGEKEFDLVYSIMEEAFPYDERRSYEEQKKLLLDSRYQIYGLFDSANAALKAFITFYRLDGFVFAEHFATSKAYRNQGLGERILQELTKMLEERICLEVELPETEFAKRRIAFYQRNGFSLNPYPYMQPPISAGREELPLLLMTTGGALTEAEFLRIQKVLYREIYHVDDLAFGQKEREKDGRH